MKGQSGTRRSEGAPRRAKEHPKGQKEAIRGLIKGAKEHLEGQRGSQRRNQRGNKGRRGIKRGEGVPPTVAKEH